MVRARADITVVTIAILLLVPTIAQARDKLAVLDIRIEDEAITDSEGDVLTDFLRSAATRASFLKLDVMSSETMVQLLPPGAAPMWEEDDPDNGSFEDECYEGFHYSDADGYCVPIGNGSSDYSDGIECSCTSTPMTAGLGLVVGGFALTRRRPQEQLD